MVALPSGKNPAWSKLGNTHWSLVNSARFIALEMNEMKNNLLVFEKRCGFGMAVFLFVNEKSS